MFEAFKAVEKKHSDEDDDETIQSLSKRVRITKWQRVKLHLTAKHPAENDM